LTRTSAIIIAVALIVAGAGLLLRSPYLAVSSANTWLRSVGGGAETSLYIAVVQGFMSSYRLLGLVLLLSGLAAALRRERGE
jgi:hypothetical protein